MPLVDPPPLSYFPVSRRPFEFTAGLRRLPVTAVAAADQIFQFDHEWPRYRAAKLTSRAERFDKYVCAAPGHAGVHAHVARFLLETLCREHGALFQRRDDGATTRLHCRLSGETLRFDADLALIGVDNPAPGDYRDALDALLCQIPDDLAVTTLNDDGDAITYLHLCLPNYWAAEDKIGQSFVAAHAPVPAMDKINQQSPPLLQALVRRGPFERFTWGLTSDDRLNHHPAPPPGVDASHWRGRRFDPAQPSLFLRVERQVTLGLPAVRAFVFTIRTYHYDVRDFDAERVQRLIANIETMPAAVLVYKGLGDDKDAILSWLRQLHRDAPQRSYAPPR